MTRSLLFITGLMGASAVALGAVAAHVAGGEALSRASLITLAHAAVLLAIALHTTPSKLLFIAASVLTLGTTLFTADMAMRAFNEHALFHYAAPWGGSLMIMGWLLIAISSLKKVP